MSYPNPDEPATPSRLQNIVLKEQTDQKRCASRKEKKRLNESK
jgi:hypothetical protein